MYLIQVNPLKLYKTLHWYRKRKRKSCKDFMIFFSYYKLKKDLRWLDFSYQNSLENLLTSEWLKSNATIIINRKNKFNK